MEEWAQDRLGEPDVMVELTMRTMMQSMSATPLGSGFALQMTFRAFTLAQSQNVMDLATLIPGAQIPFAIYGVYEAWRMGH